MSIIQFPFDSKKTQVRHGPVHLARAESRFTILPTINIRLAVDFDGSKAFPFRNTVLEDSLLPLFARASNSRPMLVDVLVDQQVYPSLPSVLLELRSKSTNSQLTARIRTRVVFSELILRDHFGLFADCHGVFGRSDFPADVTCSSTMTDFVVQWP